MKKLGIPGVRTYQVGSRFRVEEGDEDEEEEEDDEEDE